MYKLAPDADKETSPFECVECDFYSRATDEDLSAGIPLRKKPLECEVSVCSNSENAIR
jgi:hypothetical protein